MVSQKRDRSTRKRTDLRSNSVADKLSIDLYNEEYEFAEKEEGIRDEIDIHEFFKNKSIKAELANTPAFVYGKVWFYNEILTFMFGENWQQSKAIKIVRSMTDFNKLPKTRKHLIILMPFVTSKDDLNHLVSIALNSRNIVWFIGYPSTLQKHLLASFHSFFLCHASATEAEILQDVTEITQSGIIGLEEHMHGLLVTTLKIKTKNRYLEQPLVLVMES